jgi:hypothetical protein
VLGDKIIMALKVQGEYTGKNSMVWLSDNRQIGCIGMNLWAEGQGWVNEECNLKKALTDKDHDICVG